ncbi:uncharacterized protein LOC131677612 [Topomyia yanbarensis]|uniref:uncharacterized protein LOC131677612 n=1 Tax=Topomyia yanbarensis TaxID=2498891 RepID=UPI00273C9EB9|nr:uncharacterized protein LOC131677612 [Topomyia yanbarensis]
MPFQVSSTSVIITMLVLVQLSPFIWAASAGVIPAAPSAKEVSGSDSAVSDLLDENKLEFLKSCDKSSDKEELVCEVYRNLTFALGKRAGKPVTAETIKKVLEEKDALEEEHFCDNLSTVLRAVGTKEAAVGRDLVAQQQQRNMREPLTKDNVCKILCLSLTEENWSTVVKPICRVILWGFQQLLLTDSTKGNDPVVPPLMPVPVGIEKSPEKNVTLENPNMKPPVNVTKPTVRPGLSEANPKLPVAIGEEKAQKAEPDVQSPTVPKSPTGGELKQSVDPSKKLENIEDDQDQLFDDQDKVNEKNLQDINGSVKTDPFQDGAQAGEAIDDENTNYDNDEEGFQEQVELPKEDSVKIPELPAETQAASKQESNSNILAEVQREKFREDPFFEETDSNFFSYFLFVMFACIMCYVAYHNKTKIFALVLEGRRSNSGRGGFSKDRKHTAAYRKLDSNLEEAITSNTVASSRSTSQIIY